MTKLLSIAILSIAACAISTGAWGQKVYKCGNSYSQIPCANAVPVETGDARSKTQKVDADKQIARDAKLAEGMEKARLKEEAQVLAQDKAAHKNAEKTKEHAKSRSEADEAIKKKTKKKEPEFFTAKSADKKPDDSKK